MAATEITRPTADHGRFELLVPLRGLIALAVVLHHVCSFDVGVPSARVVMFFVISGYCIFASAESVMARGRAVGGWMVKRVLRIWPPYVLALGYLGVMLWVRERPMRVLHTEQSPMVWGLNVVMAAWVRLVGEPMRAAWHNPDLVVPMHWTLGYEVQFYAVVAAALGMGMLGKGRLRWLALGMGVVGVVAAMASRGLQFGTITDYAACFAVGGAVYYRGLSAMAVRGRRVIDAGLVALLVGSLGVVAWETVAAAGSGGRSAAVELAVASGFGIGLIVVRPLSGAVSRMRWIAPLNWLGTISYSLFLIHPINLPLVNAMTDAVLPDDAPKWVVVGVRLAWHVALGAAFWWVCERPFVRLMGRRRETVAKGPVAERAETGTMAERVSAMLPS